MTENLDYLTKEDIDKIKKISAEEKLYLYQIGKKCEIEDKGFWSRIMNGKKPIPEHSRFALNQLFYERNLI